MACGAAIADISSSSSSGKGRKRRVLLATGGSKRFVYTSRDALDAAAQGVVLKNTLRVNEWAKKNLLGPFILTKGVFLRPLDAISINNGGPI